MSKSKEEFTEQRDNFYSRLEEDQEYANVSMTMYALNKLESSKVIREHDYTITETKTNKKQK